MLTAERGSAQKYEIERLKPSEGRERGKSESVFKSLRVRAGRGIGQTVQHCRRTQVFIGENLRLSESTGPTELIRGTFSDGVGRELI